MCIATSGTSAGTLLFPPILQLLFDHYGFTSGILFHAGLLLNLAVVASLFQPIQSDKQGKKRLDECSRDAPISDKTTNKKAMIATGCRKIVHTMGLHHFMSVLYIFYIILLSSMYLSWCCGVLYMSGLAKEKCNLTDGQIAIILSIGSAFPV